MNDKHIFVDSNILVYAHDIDTKQKHTIAQQKITYLWSNDIRPFISIQVLQECSVTFVRNSLPPKMAKSIVLSYLAWNVIDNDQHNQNYDGIRVINPFSE